MPAPPGTLEARGAGGGNSISSMGPRLADLERGGLGETRPATGLADDKHSHSHEINGFGQLLPRPMMRGFAKDVRRRRVGGRLGVQRRLCGGLWPIRLLLRGHAGRGNSRFSPGPDSYVRQDVRRPSRWPSKNVTLDEGANGKRQKAESSPEGGEMGRRGREVSQRLRLPLRVNCLPAEEWSSVTGTAVDRAC